MKNLSTKFLILFLLALAILSGYNYFHTPFLDRFTPPEGAEIQRELTREEFLEEQLVALSTTAKVRQLVSQPVTLGIATSSAQASESAIVEISQESWTDETVPGFITLFGSDLSLETVAEFTQRVANAPVSFAPLVAVDHEGGSVQRLRGEGFSALPSWRQNCQTETAELRMMFARSATELRQAGIQIVFAPVLDVARSNSFLGGRACTTENEAVYVATEYITSFSASGILPVVKHFPGIGAATNDLHFRSDSVVLESQDTAPFSQILGMFPNVGLMTAHVVVQDKTDGVPCSLSATCLSQFSTHFPQALLFTDALEMVAASVEEGADAARTLPERAVLAVLAGNDVLVFGNTVRGEEIEEVVLAMETEYNENEAFRHRVDLSIKKVLQLKIPQPK